MITVNCKYISVNTVARFILVNNSADYVEYCTRVAKKIKSEKEYITALDAATGDGDHWVNLNMGFQALVEQADDLSTMSLPALLMKIGMILMSTIGGSSGVLYGSAYMSASKAIGEREVLDKQALSDMLNAMLEGICHRGNSQPGMKTMIDPLYLAANAYKSALERDSEVVSALRAMKAAAQEGMEKTKDMEAVRGRAYYQADKGRGHLDPGAVTMFYQLAILVDCILEKLSTAN